MSKKETAANIIKKIIYINLATICEDGSPWNTAVYFAYDNELNFYWTSSPKNIHSQNIARDGRVFVTIYDSTVPEGTGEGVYLQGIATALEDFDEIKHARACTQSRKGEVTVTDQEVEEFVSARIRKIYKFVPRQAWLNDDKTDDAGNYVHDIRVELDLAKLKDTFNE